jgi:hypothetical protein
LPRNVQKSPVDRHAKRILEARLDAIKLRERQRERARQHPTTSPSTTLARASVSKARNNRSDSGTSALPSDNSMTAFMFITLND